LNLAGYQVRTNDRQHRNEFIGPLGLQTPLYKCVIPLAVTVSASNFMLLIKNFGCFLFITLSFATALRCNPIKVAEWVEEVEAFHLVAQGDGCDVDVLVKTDGALSIRRISGKFQKSSEDDGTFTVKIYDNLRDEPYILHLDPIRHTITGNLPGTDNPSEGYKFQERELGKDEKDSYKEDQVPQDQSASTKSGVATDNKASGEGRKDNLDGELNENEEIEAKVNSKKSADNTGNTKQEKEVKEKTDESQHFEAATTHKSNPDKSFSTILYPTIFLLSALLY
jgi:hypothetical protein